MKRLTSLVSWAHCSDKVNSLKAPAVGLGKSKPISYSQAKENAKHKVAGSPYYGLVFGDESEYIGLDVDIDPSGKKSNVTKTIPPEVLFFIKANPTHVHYSPSGHGIHIIYRLNKETQEKLNILKLNQKAVSQSTGDLFNGDWRYRKSFLVFTDKLHPLSSNEIAYIDYNNLLTVLPSISTNGNGTTAMMTTQLPKISKAVPALSKLEELLRIIPPTFNKKAQRACNNLPYAKPGSNYDYWVLIGCGCAHHALLLNNPGGVLELFHSWSQQDTESYINFSDVEQKFMLLYKSTAEKIQQKINTTTIGALAVIAKGCIIDFPDMIAYGPKDNKKLRPDPASVKNLQTLIKHDELELVFDPMGGGVSFKGSEELVVKWFCPSVSYYAMRPTGYSQVASISDMAIRFKPYMQARYMFSVGSQYSREAIDFLCQSMRMENAFKCWITSKPWDKERRFKPVCESIKFPEQDNHNRDTYISYIRRALLSMIGIHFWPEDAPKIPAMIVLTGPEYTYKSSWAEWLIPKHMSNYAATADITTVLIAGREWQMFLSTKAVVVINECEPMFSPKHEQKVKSSVDSESVTYRDPYAKHVLSRPRTALIIGTTNKANLFTGSTGTRKIWQIPVKECDSMLIKDMDLQQLYAEIHYKLNRFKLNNPSKLIQDTWAQSAEDRQVTNRLNAERKGGDLGTIGLLIERFGHFLRRKFDVIDYIGKRGITVRPGKPGSIDNEPNAWTISAMFKFLRFEYPDDRIDRVSVKYALEEYSAGFTNTTHQPENLFSDYLKGGKNKDKLVVRGYVVLSKTTGYYLMPIPLNIEEENYDK